MLNLRVTWELSPEPTDSYLVKIGLNGQETSHPVASGQNSFDYQAPFGSSSSAQVATIDTDGNSSGLTQPVYYVDEIPEQVENVQITRI